MPSGSNLKIKAFQEKNSVNVTISDMGIGISDEAKSKLFQLLVATKSKGQVFGLAVVERLIEAREELCVLKASLEKEPCSK
ncbi:MAG TPA: ATP-binding protein [Candidatus Acidoferrales bacterium]|nr:ATP-binding protein [Candidatus Acidoferrales bacterium]